MPSSEPIKGARFLEKRIHFIPGVESAFLVHLSMEEDLYLQDHCYDGSYLFPTVFGLEAMAQVVANITGINGFNGVRIEGHSSKAADRRGPRERNRHYHLGADLGKNRY